MDTEKELTKSQLYYIKNKEKINEKCKSYYENNVDKYAQYYLKNKEKMNNYSKNYCKTYYQDHKDEIIKKNSERQSQKILCESCNKLVKKYYIHKHNETDYHKKRLIK